MLGIGFKMSVIYCCRILTSQKWLKNKISASEFGRKGRMAKGLFPTTVPTAILILALSGFTGETETTPKFTASEWWIPAALPSRGIPSIKVVYDSLYIISIQHVMRQRTLTKIECLPEAKGFCQLQPAKLQRAEMHPGNRFHRGKDLLTVMNKKKKFWSGYPRGKMSFCHRRTCVTWYLL